jgi:hypothetical protein
LPAGSAKIVPDAVLFVDFNVVQYEPVPGHSPSEPAELPATPRTGATLNAGAAEPLVLFPNRVPPAALESEKVSAGVVAAVATEVAKRGERFPALKEVTVPPAVGQV